MRKGKKAGVLALLFVLSFTTSAEVIYQCVLPDGRTLSQDRPCPRKFSPEEIATARERARPAPALPPRSQAIAPAVVDPAPAREQPSAQATASSAECSCDTDNICTGKRGGRYCMTAGGKKRYLKRQSH